MTWLEDTLGQCRVLRNLELQAQTDQMELIGKNIEEDSGLKLQLSGDKLVKI